MYSGICVLRKAIRSDFRASAPASNASDKVQVNRASAIVSRPCSSKNELNGANFFFPPRDRVLDLDEYHRSLDNLAKQQVYNPERRRPWSKEDAAERWEQVQRQAVKDKEDCQLVASLPALQKQLADMESKAAATAQKKD